MSILSVAITHDEGKCKKCDEYIAHLSKAAEQQAIMIDEKLIKKSLFEAFPFLQWEWDELHEYINSTNDYADQITQDLKSAEHAESDLKDCIQDLEDKLQSIQQTGWIACIPLQEAASNGQEPRMHGTISPGPTCRWPQLVSYQSEP